MYCRLSIIRCNVRQSFIKYAKISDEAASSLWGAKYVVIIHISDAIANQSDIMYKNLRSLKCLH